MRGYNAIFTYLQRQLKNKKPNFSTRGISNFDQIRNQIWQKVAGDVNNKEIKLNGRLTDSYIRCFESSVRLAINAWKSDIKPLLKNVQATDEKLEIISKSMEALVYLSASSSRPDIALEVAMATRNKNWTMEMKQSLARAYVHGKRRLLPLEKEGNQKKMEGVSFFQSSSIKAALLRGFERSFEAEVGILLTEEAVRKAMGIPISPGKLPGQNIRLIFSEKRRDD